MAQVKRDQGLAFLAYTAEVSSAQDELPLPIPIALFSSQHLVSRYVPLVCSHPSLGAVAVLGWQGPLCLSFIATSRTLITPDLTQPGTQ